MNRAGLRSTALFVLFALVAAVIAARAHYSADLSAFLPRSPTATQQLLVEQLREGPGRASHPRGHRWRGRRRARARLDGAWAHAAHGSRLRERQ